MSSKTPYLTTDRTHTYNWSLSTDVYRPDAGWKLHVELIWHRPAPHKNIKKNVYLKFNPNCVDATGTGRLLPAAPGHPLSERRLIGPGHSGLRLGHSALRASKREQRGEE